jgi:hypothetical protein
MSRPKANVVKYFRECRSWFREKPVGSWFREKPVGSWFREKPAVQR